MTTMTDSHSNVSQRPHEKQYQILGFAAIFLGFLLATFFLANESAVQAFFKDLKYLTVYLIVLFSETMGIEVSSYDQYVRVSGFLMNITFGCTAFVYYGIYAAAVLSYPRHSIRYKLLGLAVGISVLFLVNIFRIILLGVIGANVERQIFDIIHVYIWQGLYALIVFHAWIFWVKKKVVESNLLRFVTVAVLALSAFTVVLWLGMDWYVAAVAFVSQKVLSIIGGGYSFSVVEDNIFMRRMGKEDYISIYLYIYDTAVFLALMAATVGRDNFSRVIKRTGIGLAFLTVFQIAMVVAAAYILHYYDEKGAEAFWFASWISIALPLILFMVLGWREIKGGIFEERKQSIPA